jgi:hypothetical protein
VRELQVRALRTMVAAAMVGAATIATVEPAHAGPKECIAAADEGQKLRDDGKLTAARDKFITCAAKACPGAVAKQCSQWLIEAEHDTPTVTFRALDEQGKETLAVRVLIDGVAVVQSIDARALSVDPGEHAVRFELASGHAVEDKVLVRPGEKNKMIELSFQPKAPPPSAAKPGPVAPPVAPPEEGGGFHIPTLGWVGLGVGVAGGVMTALFAISANNAESDLRSTCAPGCNPSEKSSIDTKIVLANVGLGIGIVGLGVAVVTTVLANTGHKAPPKTAAPAASPVRVGFDVTPGSVLLRGAF